MNLRQVKARIRSTGNVKKITKAMQLVSAVKMKKAQQLAIEGQPYRHYLDEILHKVSAAVSTEDSIFFQPKKSDKEEKELVIVITSNKGLCGAFNVNVFRLLLKDQDFNKAEFLTVGSKGAAFVARLKGKIIADYSSQTPIAQVSALFDQALGEYMAGNYTKISIVYNKFISTLRSEPVKETILPVEPQKREEQEINTEYIIEPSPKEILEALFKSYIEEKIRGAIINSEASEHSQRMIAMKNATDNATDLIYSYTLLGNKLRQEKITYELLDMITATTIAE